MKRLDDGICSNIAKYLLYKNNLYGICVCVCMCLCSDNYYNFILLQNQLVAPNEKPIMQG